MLPWIYDQFLAIGFNENLSRVFSHLTLAGIILVVAFISNIIAKTLFVKALRGIIRRIHQPATEALVQYKVIHRLSHIVPALVIYLAAPLFSTSSEGIGETISAIIQMLMKVYMIAAVTLAIDSLLNALQELYSTFQISIKRPIKTYVQVIKLALYLFATVFIVSTLLNKSPWGFFTGIGAAMAIILLVFKDSILGFVASIQLASYDMVRIGDWITIPKYKADGDVEEISLTTVKIRNFDKTITTVPTYDLLASGVQNWRGMSESGGRRIKRAINIDLNSIKFCTPEMIDKFKKIEYLQNYFSSKLEAIDRHNSQKLGQDMPLNMRKLSNVGVFRAYINEFLRANQNIHKEGYTFLIRQLQPTELGLPIELYIFTNDTNWVNYEHIQADIFDHLLAALPVFELRAFQNLSSHDLHVVITQKSE